jgi:hypothetical protein
MSFFDLQNNVEVICGLEKVPEDCGITKDRQRLVPRVGVAYRLGSSMVIRAGFGIANDPTSNLNGMRLDAPYVYSQLINPPNSFGFATTLRQGLPVVTPPDLNRSQVPWPGIANANTMNNDQWARGYIESWNFTVEKRFMGWVGSAAYAGSRAVDAPYRLEQNWGPIGGGAAGQQLAKFGRGASNLLFGTMGTNNYNSLQLRAAHAYASGFQTSVSYTFSKALGYANTTATNGATGTPPVAIPAFYSKNYGPMQTNIPQNFQVTAVYQLPWGKGRPWLNSGVASKILGCWQLSGLFSAYSGLPFTVTGSVTSLNAPFSSQFGDCLAPASYTGNILALYDKSAFGIPANGRFGTCGINSLRGPHIVNFDAGLDRNIAITERWNLKFRAEMFNVGNTPHHATINATNSSVNASTFMQAFDIANTGREGIDERAARLSLKLTW